MNPYASLQMLRNELDSRALSSVELTQMYLTRINKLDAEFNCFITLAEEKAMFQAEQADAQIAAGQGGALTGIPMAHKDIFLTQGIRTSCASRMLDKFIAPYDSTVAKKLNHAGMVCLGKTNMDEFAMGSSNENSYYGSTKNPWNTEHVPGGSSGGSAAAVAAALVPVTTGTDTGGSIRQPAAFCGVSGIKPTYGRVSRYGMIAFASSLDQGGVLAHSTADMALMLSAMGGFDAQDSTSADQSMEDILALTRDSEGFALSGKKITIGLPKEYLQNLTNAELEAVYQNVQSVFSGQGIEFRDVSLPHTHVAVPTYYVLASAEASTNLSRYDGVRYGHRCESPKNLEDLYVRSRSEGFGEEVKRRILTGTYTLSVGYYDAYYVQAQKVRRLIANDFTKVFSEVDLLMTPTTPSPAFKIGQLSKDPVEMYHQDVFTIPASLAGLPSMSIPCGMQEGLPLGLQLIAPHFKEALLLKIGNLFQQHTDWHTQYPETGQNL
ncbi:MAG: Asp-tRNA(Asn)/Glu-tRNA(Gln) amidotransferase subunit GatA [Pseudomonadales bacterium]|nr:Asp-tRNA(Asn)/Glu-tRNA(Gln) amidotransferase subunit GatA [Pseudomonadales bacterium]